MSDLKPYRVEWRPHLMTGWLLIASVDKREDADHEAAGARSKWGGQTRVIAQHVIETTGLGA